MDFYMINSVKIFIYILYGKILNVDVFIKMLNHIKIMEQKASQFQTNLKYIQILKSGI